MIETGTEGAPGGGTRGGPHRYWVKVNESVCSRALDGACDRVGRDPSRYSRALRWSALYEFLYPLVSAVVWCLFTAQFSLSVFAAVWFSALLPLLPLVLAFNLAVGAVLLLVGLALDLLYLLYLGREIGIYALIPVFAFAAQILLSTVPLIGDVLSKIVGVLPWGFFAVGVHFIHYQVGKKVVFNCEEASYETVESGSWGLSW